MQMIKAIIRPEKVDKVLEDLMAAGFPAVTKMGVVGRGKQRGSKSGKSLMTKSPKK
jgi:nitrogen regulatory protein PII 1